MKIAILETVKADGGFELEFDHIIIETLRAEGHEPILFVPPETDLGRDLHAPIKYLIGGKIVSYDGVHGIKKIWRSLQREYRRVKWFDAMMQAIRVEEIDTVLITTATYRYLRALRRSSLKDSPVPVRFIFLGVNPQEKPKFIKAASSCLPYQNIRLYVTTLRDDFRGTLPANTRLIPPPVMAPPEMSGTSEGDVLKIGFFGHYRRGEKKLEWFLRLAEENDFARPVQMILQIAPTDIRDREEVDAIAQKYRHLSHVTLITEKLIEEEWYRAIAGVDTVFLPYTAERYLYNWSALYFTAIGFRKTVITTPVLNPEVLEEFEIGKAISMDTFEEFRRGMRDFVDTFDRKKEIYRSNLLKASDKYSKKNFIRHLLQ